MNNLNESVMDIDKSEVKKTTRGRKKAPATVDVTVAEIPLKDGDEITVVSLIPNVSYMDKATGDYYKWDEVDHEELMTYATLKNMWRNHKGYFRKLCLKPMDERVIKKFGLTNLYKSYGELMDESVYIKANISKLTDLISSIPNDIKGNVARKIKNLVRSERITDITVIRFLEKQFDIELYNI